MKEDLTPEEQEEMENATTYILKQTYRKTKMFSNLGKITYGDCIDYKAFKSASLAVANVIAKEDVLFKIPSALLITDTVQQLIPYIESLTPIEIGKKMWESLN